MTNAVASDTAIMGNVEVTVSVHPHKNSESTSFMIQAVSLEKRTRQPGPTLDCLRLLVVTWARLSIYAKKKCMIAMKDWTLIYLSINLSTMSATLSRIKTILGSRGCLSRLETRPNLPVLLTITNNGRISEQGATSGVRCQSISESATQLWVHPSGLWPST